MLFIYIYLYIYIYSFIYIYIVLFIYVFYIHLYTYVYFISLFCFDALRFQILSIWHLSFILYMYIRTLKWSSQQNKQLVGGFATSSRLAIFNHNFRRLISRGTVKNIFPGVFILVLVHSGTKHHLYEPFLFKFAVFYMYMGGAFSLPRTYQQVTSRS